MQKLLMVSALAVISLSVPQIASAQNSPQGQQQQSIQARVKNNLEQAGFTNVQIMPSSFLVRAKDKEGNPVMMVINPNSVTAITEVSGDNHPGAPAHATTGAAATNDRLNLTSAQRQEIWQNVSKQAAKETSCRIYGKGRGIRAEHREITAAAQQPEQPSAGSEALRVCDAAEPGAHSRPLLQEDRRHHHSMK